MLSWQWSNVLLLMFTLMASIQTLSRHRGSRDEGRKVGGEGGIGDSMRGGEVLERERERGK